MFKAGEKILVDGLPVFPIMEEEVLLRPIHLYYDEGCLCLRAKGKTLDPFANEVLTDEPPRVTCPECLELIHS
jgi:hypothetical protein